MLFAFSNAFDDAMAGGVKPPLMALMGHDGKEGGRLSSAQ